MFSFCKLLAIYVSRGVRATYDPWAWEWYVVESIQYCYTKVMLHDTMWCPHYSGMLGSLQVDHFSLKGDLNSCFRKKLLVYDHKMLWPNCHTFRCWFLMMCIHRIVVHYANNIHLIECRCSFLNKLNMVFHVSSFAVLQCICPQHLNRVNRRLKRISKEETRYHEPFSFDLKDRVDCKRKFWTLVQVI